MIATPFGAVEHMNCRTPAISIGALFTQEAIQAEEYTVSLNVDEIQAGDVVLFSRPQQSSFKFHPVYRYQRIIIPDRDAAQWTHCALVDENLTIWDAMPNANVRSRPLREILREKHLLKLVRPKVAPDRMRLRTSLLQFSNYEYRMFNITTLGRLGARLANVGINPKKKFDDKSVICSLFVADILRRSATYGFFRNIPIVVPADFAIDSEFFSVSLRWCNVKP